jgi:ABC-2 type transport system permease protein
MMEIRKAVALFRASWQSALTYRLRLVLSIGSMLLALIPVFIVARALNPVMEESIANEGGEYFAFLLVGLLVLSLLTTMVTSLPAAVGSGIGTGTLEAMLATPTSLPALLGGMMGYSVVWTAIRCILVLAGGVALGMHVALDRLLPAAFIVLLIVLAYLPIGLLGAAAVVAFRTAGPFGRIALAVSALGGGVYYPTHVIPDAIQGVSTIIPLTYGLRALRRTILDGMSLPAVAADVAILACFAAVLFAIGSYALLAALRYSRRVGTLSHY